MSPALFRRLHRWIGLACAVTVLAATGSGILHVVMTWTQSPPPRPQPAGTIDAAAVRIAPAEAVERLGGRDLAVQSLSLRTLGGEPWYQVLTAGSPVPLYVNALDGREDAEVDQRYAVEIAARQFGAFPLRWTRRLDVFDSEYISIFRLLPVHRIDVDDGQGTRLYVSTQTGSVARLTSDRRQFEANVFSWFHKYSFIRHKGWRDGLLVAFTTLAFLTSLAGIALFFATRRRTPSLQIQ
jgi:hypothetical protein